MNWAATGQLTRKCLTRFAAQLAKRSGVAIRQKAQLMKPPVPPLLFAWLLLVGMVVMLEAGRRVGMNRRQKTYKASRATLASSKARSLPYLGWSSHSRFPERCRALTRIEC